MEPAQNCFRWPPAAAYSSFFRAAATASAGCRASTSSTASASVGGNGHLAAFDRVSLSSGCLCSSLQHLEALKYPLGPVRGPGCQTDRWLIDVHRTCPTCRQDITGDTTGDEADGCVTPHSSAHHAAEIR